MKQSYMTLYGSLLLVIGLGMFLSGCLVLRSSVAIVIGAIPTLLGIMILADCLEQRRQARKRHQLPL